MAGFVVLVFLTLLACVAAVLWAVRTRPAGRAELALTASLLWNAIVLVPIYVLGFTSRLTARPLGWLSLVFFGALVGGAFVKRAPRDVVREGLAAVAGIVALPGLAVRAAWRARSLAVVTVAMTITLLVWSAITAYYAPSWKGWDALWYHEPIIGFTLQNHGFRALDLPSSIQKINGYPRLCELTYLWFVVFTDRRLIDLGGVLMAPSLVLGVFVLARRYGPDVPALGWACAVLLAPACTNVIQTTYVDVHAAVFLIAAVHYATRSPMRLGDGWLASLALGMAVVSKSHAVLAAPLIAVIAVVRLARASRGRTWATVGTIAGGGAVLLVITSTLYIKNWVVFKNPFWPELAYDNPKLGIHWPGAYGWAGAGGPGVSSVDMNEPWPQLFDDLVSIPFSWHRWHYGEVHEYGFAVPWLLVPLGALAVMAIAASLVGDRVAVIFNLPRWRAADDTKNAALLIPVILVMLYFSPALWAARYQIPAMALLVALVSWAGGRRGWTQLAHGAAGAATLAAVVTFFWAQPRTWFLPRELTKLAHVPYPERELTVAAAISPVLDLHIGSPAITETGRARERELGKDTVLVFDEDFGNFPALFWNDHFSNRAVFVPGGPDWVARIEAVHPTWAYAGHGDPNSHALKASPDWEEVGVLFVENWGTVFRRKRGAL